MSDKEYKTSEYVVGFIDILGATNAIMKQTDTSLDVVHKIYENAIKTFSKLSEFDRPQIKIFSDNIVVAVPYDKSHSKKNALYAVAVMSAALQANFLAHGWLTRGGISAGDFFVDDVMVWGSALVRAYKLESTIAYFPRVVIDPSLAEECNLARMAQYAKEKNEKDGVFLIDNDGIIRLEMLLGAWSNTTYTIFKEFENGILERQLKENRGNTKVCQKWLWIDHYIKERRKVLPLESGDTDAKRDEGQRD